MIDIVLGACLIFNAPHVDEIGSTRFINIVTNDPYGAPAAHLKENIQTPYIDPPIGNWQYGPINNNDDIYYWDKSPLSNHSVVNFVDEKQIQFVDCPVDTRLKSGDFIEFTTLVVNSNNKEVLHVVDWKLDHLKKTTVTFSGLKKLDADIKELISPWQKEK